jgi:SAM-dependent methyltransferase
MVQSTIRSEEDLTNKIKMRSIKHYIKKIRSVYRFFAGYQDELWDRIIMNRETERWIASLEPENLTALEISGTFWRKMPFKEYKTVHFPEYDVCVSPLSQKFDLIIAEQVFEHLCWPYRAGRNLYQMLNDGGHFLITVPFLVRVHGAPIDCMRWTETGLKYFLAECGFQLDKIKTGSWGNRRCIKASYFKWQFYYRRLHSLKNEPDFPMQVWALAEKGKL